VEAFADAVGLRALHLGTGVIDVLHREIELVLVVLRRPAILGASIRQHPREQDALVVEEGKHAIVE